MIACWPQWRFSLFRGEWLKWRKTWLQLAICVTNILREKEDIINVRLGNSSISGKNLHKSCLSAANESLLFGSECNISNFWVLCWTEKVAQVTTWSRTFFWSLYVWHHYEKHLTWSFIGSPAATWEHHILAEFIFLLSEQCKFSKLQHTQPHSSFK